MVRESRSIIEALDRIAQKLAAWPATGVLRLPSLKSTKIVEALDTYSTRTVRKRVFMISHAPGAHTT
jgi:hypothetical protein